MTTASPLLLTRPVPATAGDARMAAWPIVYRVAPSGETCMSKHDNWDDALAALSRLRERDYYNDATIDAQHVAPDGMAPLTGAWAGGTWSGGCGATAWKFDPDEALRVERYNMVAFLHALGDRSDSWSWQHYTSMDRVSSRQTWYVLGNNGAKDWHGFRIECTLRFRHDGPCRALDWTFDPNAGLLP